MKHGGNFFTHFLSAGKQYPTQGMNKGKTVPKIATRMRILLHSFKISDDICHEIE
jgi:hypothetical protein